MTSLVPKTEATKQKGAPYLLTDPLPAVLAFDSMFDNRVIRRPSIDKCNSIQRDTDSDEVEDFVDECTARGKSNR